MRDTIKSEDWKHKIFSINTDADFEQLAIEMFRLHYEHNPLYSKYVKMLYPKLNPLDVKDSENIPFLPIRFFKSHEIMLSGITPVDYFASSGTGGVSSKHYIADYSIYEQSCIEGFKKAFGDPKDYTFLALLPNYLEQQHSSLIYMVQTLMKQNPSPYHGFYLYEYDKLRELLKKLEAEKRPTLLIGVSYALLDLASEAFGVEPTCIKIMETGGMKGRRKEMVRSELHDILKKSLNVDFIYSEYGMCELFSQAYLHKNGLFVTPPWMKILLRSTHNPLNKAAKGENGGINVIDLANVYSCPFVETQDIGRLHPDGGFEVLGRFDGSDLRGCNLMVE